MISYPGRFPRSYIKWPFIFKCLWIETMQYDPITFIFLCAQLTAVIDELFYWLLLIRILLEWNVFSFDRPGLHLGKQVFLDVIFIHLVFHTINDCILWVREKAQKFQNGVPDLDCFNKWRPDLKRQLRRKAFKRGIYGPTPRSKYLYITVKFRFILFLFVPQDRGCIFIVYYYFYFLLVSAPKRMNGIVEKNKNEPCLHKISKNTYLA